MRSAVTKVAKALSSIPLLTCVDIELRYFDMDDVPTTLSSGTLWEFCHVLQGFSSLRNVRKVSPQWSAARLREILDTQNDRIRSIGLLA